MSTFNHTVFQVAMLVIILWAVSVVVVFMRHAYNRWVIRRLQQQERAYLKRWYADKGMKFDDIDDFHFWSWIGDYK